MLEYKPKGRKQKKPTPDDELSTEAASDDQESTEKITQDNKNSHQVKKCVSLLFLEIKRFKLLIWIDLAGSIKSVKSNTAPTVFCTISTGNK